ncbi:MAG: ion transporter [Flavobacteriales bacterium]|nr:ion transporter [Flavobacteriales bacterium]
MKTSKATSWKTRLHDVIFEADTFLGKFFDISLLILILFSVAAVMIESVELYSIKYKNALTLFEWTITAIFSLEYLLRIISVKKPLKYIFSFYGLIDLISLLPTYLGLFMFSESISSIKTIRTIRLLRVFRILKLIRYVKAANTLKQALIASRQRIIVFLLAVLAVATIMGTIIYIIEDSKDGFTSIPRSIYWAIVTLTTVGYGDIAPQTVLGQFFASIIMILGYAIIAVPTGMVSVELALSEKMNTQSCPSCSAEGHENNAKHCKHCGAELNPPV